MVLAQIGTQSQTNVVALCSLQAKLTCFNARKLLERTMIHFDQPGSVSQELTLSFSHLQTVGRPVIRVAMWVNQSQPKPRISLRFSRLLYQLSKATHAG